jgi:hypothetical protein
MAILKSSLDEPLLTREQMSIIRDIAHAAQIANAIKELTIVKDMIITPGNVNWQANDKYPEQEHITNLLNYLKAEASRVLMQIKIPRRQLAITVQADPKDSVIKPSATTPS